MEILQTIPEGKSYHQCRAPLEFIKMKKKTEESMNNIQINTKNCTNSNNCIKCAADETQCSKYTAVFCRVYSSGFIQTKLYTSMYRPL